MLMMLLPLFALAAQPATSPPPAPPPALPAAEPAPVTPTGPDPRPYVALVTDLGTITVRLEARRAPVTAKNFLRYVDTRRMDGFKFYRSTRTWGSASRLLPAGKRVNAARNSAAIAHGTTPKHRPHT